MLRRNNKTIYKILIFLTMF